MSSAEIETDDVLFEEEKKEDDRSSAFGIDTIKEENEENDEVKNKTVKFAEDEAIKFDAQRDQERSRQELLSKIARLTETLNDAQKQIQIEKDKRKKKEKSLLKLAKELKKRNMVREKEEDRLEELEEKKKYLEHHWVLAQKELDQEKALHAKLQKENQKEYEEIIKEEKSKFERTKTENDNRLSDLKKAHIEQSEELGREALKAKLEADRLHSELTARGMDVPRHMLFSENDSRRKKGAREPIFSVILFAILALALSSLGNLSNGVFTKSGVCSPVIPGTTFDDNAYGTFEAPWWAPASMKEKTFASLCVDKESVALVPSTIEWIRDGKNNKIVVSLNGSVVLKRSIAKTQVTNDKILFSKRNGAVEEVPFYWVSTK